MPGSVSSTARAQAEVSDLERPASSCTGGGPSSRRWDANLQTGRCACGVWAPSGTLASHRPILLAHGSTLQAAEASCPSALSCFRPGARHLAPLKLAHTGKYSGVNTPRVTLHHGVGKQVERHSPLPALWWEVPRCSLPEGIEPYCPQRPLFTHPCIYQLFCLLALGITCPIKPAACRPWSQALPIAKAPNRDLLGPSTRGANDLLSSHFSFPWTPGLCSDLLFARFRSHHISPGRQTTLVYATTINAQQSPPKPYKQKVSSARRDPIPDPGLRWGLRTPTKLLPKPKILSPL